MTSPSNVETVVDYVLRSPENVELAWIIHDQFAVISERIFDRFTMRLASRLSQSLGNDWQVHALNLWHPNSNISICKTKWRGLFDVVLEADKPKATDVYFGVRKGGRDTDEQIGKGELYKQLNQQFRHGDCNNGWEWWVYFDAPHRKWNNGEMLVAMHDEERETCKEIADQLIRTIRIAEPIIEEFISPQR